ncbi:hypothetical protein E2C01_015436 [Portunus trituberculatus]|uniref:Uncharacterized protein n=1 Tax=Portunus trituberculatus TaxID=210409 RepID=A0A5B7DLJ1_PORTR|nr:hypothetical protein [Portunus trituberculatus]
MKRQRTCACLLPLFASPGMFDKPSMTRQTHVTRSKGRLASPLLKNIAFFPSLVLPVKPYGEDSMFSLKGALLGGPKVSVERHCLMRVGGKRGGKKGRRGGRVGGGRD